jgi:hypothetical protein
MNAIISIVSKVLASDLCIGALLGVALLTLWRAYSFFTGASLRRIQSVANAPVKHFGDDQEITLVGFSRPGSSLVHHGIADFSPFVNRVENYLRMLNIKYVKRTSLTLSENPRHKMPYANIYGEMIDDSSRIIETLQRKLDIDPHDGLTQKQIATGTMLRTLLSDAFYFVMLHALVDTQAGHLTIREILQDNIAFPPLRSLFYRYMITLEHANTWGQGYGRYPESIVVEKGFQQMQAVSVLLGENKFILGTTDPTVYDTDLYAFLSVCFFLPSNIQNKWIQAIKRKFGNLLAHAERMQALLYPEFVKEVEGEYLVEEAS